MFFQLFRFSLIYLGTGQQSLGSLLMLLEGPGGVTSRLVAYCLIVRKMKTWEWKGRESLAGYPRPAQETNSEDEDC